METQAHVLRSLRNTVLICGARLLEGTGTASVDRGTRNRRESDVQSGDEQWSDASRSPDATFSFILTPSELTALSNTRSWDAPRVSSLCCIVNFHSLWWFPVAIMCDLEYVLGTPRRGLYRIVATHPR